MATDLEIAKRVALKEVEEIARDAGIPREYIEPYGRYKGKVSLDLFEKLEKKPDGKLVLVTAITPTPAGEGKTTVSIGLSLAFNRIGKRCGVALREPSMGPLFGIKGGAAGGGWSQVLPMEEINLHFTGDIHAVSAAHNLLGAVIDNHLFRRKEPLLDPRRIGWPRVMDMNDRALRNVILGLGGKENGVPREGSFSITAASEVMAVLCLSRNYEELKERLSNIYVGATYGNEPVFVRDLKVQGAMAAVLKDALKPNIVQTTENTPAFVHGGPFANIAQGANSVLATQLSMKLFDVTVTEAGFGCDLGAEKFFDIVCRYGGFAPSAVVLVATVRALKMHGGKALADLKSPDVEALKRGLENLGKQMENAALFGVPVVVAVNRFGSDSEEELETVREYAREKGIPAEVVDVWGQGGGGAVTLAERVWQEAQRPSRATPLYPLEMPLEEKIRCVAGKVYGARDVAFTSQAEADLKRIKGYGFDSLPVCIAKTQKSLSDNPALLGRPREFTLTVRGVNLSSGAGFVVPVTGEMLLMPGLPKTPAAEVIDILPDGELLGIF
ncbi:MAG TPA: formate--tetrahydrofolate ligase [Candidatus Aminicenantes bacterium]|nr:formate--tetrahydrofolate ligase [Candidatus Aminicenantes bacterium]